ncbi:MAG: FtsW/RodA/SpoVE family cell cycle protein [Acidobacteriaceae bacterium]|nr:FtsW/RodA/SpoVE family cell cycle protein [Acidobacteriaceae bacterium]MBV8570217.1 FtsW/RodA/SpoVE family cell cycle protein [Acidobacteriaceae bacterium]
MAITKSWETTVALSVAAAEVKPRERQREFWWLLAASLLVACGLGLVLLAKTQDFDESIARIANGELVNINTVDSPEQLAPVLQIDATQQVFDFIQRHKPLPNVGALARLREGGLQPARGLSPAHPSAALLPLGKLKPLLIVRTPSQFLHIYGEWIALYLASFWLVHFAWRLLKFRGDPVFLPALQLLTGIGLILMVSLRDPLRDTLEFRKFAFGVVAGCSLLLLPLLRAFQYRHFSRWIYTPLLLSLALFCALIVLGSGPTGSDAKVNLGPFQPVEAIKILLVFFMAGYFAANWERLRDLNQKRFVPRALRFLRLPRVAHVLPVMCAVSCALAFFFLLKDMGPALVIGMLFLTLYAIARNRAGLALLGVFLLVGGVIAGNHFGHPHTVVDRVSMWLSPWNNDVHGGDQLAHSLWAFATGGPWGSGPGWGDPGLIPAGHTDLVLPAIAEEWGLPGVISIALLFILLIGRAFRIALRAPDEYAFFLSAGLGVLLAFEMLLISGGALGAIPLSGVVSPFLSSGNTAMLANFLICAVLLSISNTTARYSVPAADGESEPPSIASVWQLPARVAGACLALCGCALVARAVYIQGLNDRDLLNRDAFVFASDGVKRPQHNPRLNSLAASIPRGNIYDRNGILLATSDWSQLKRYRADYERLGVNIDQACSKTEPRHYPFGPALVHVLGDLRTGQNFHATNVSFIEHDSNTKLQGYRDYSDLAAFVRYRHQRANPVLQSLLARDRNVRSTIDIRLQLKLTDIMKTALEKAGKKGALVVMDAQSGDVLSLVTWPAPPAAGTATPDELLDRSRYGEYPPGSTFKLVTAIAALRLNPNVTSQRYACRRLPDGRVGTIIPGWRRPIRDDFKDRVHGTLDLAGAITVSCNAYFAQLGVYSVGTNALRQTAGLLGITAGSEQEIKKMLPFAAYGQGPVVATPFKMARVAATIANEGIMPEGHWVSDSSNSRTEPAVQVLPVSSADFLARAMRSVVTSGTARSAMAGEEITVAGKTGTAQLDSGDPHSWFAGFAPYDAPPAKRIAFAMIVEHGGYGAQVAAPIARQVIEAAQQLGVIENDSPQGR